MWKYLWQVCDLKVYVVWVRALYCIHMIIVTIMFMDVVVMYAYGGVWCFGCILDVLCIASIRS